MGGHFLEGHAEEAVVEGEWAEGFGLPGEAHQGDAVALQGFQALGDFRLGPFQPAGAQVVGQHAPGEVHQEDHLPSLAVDGFRAFTPGGFRQGHDEEEEGQKEESPLRPGAARGLALGEELPGIGAGRLFQQGMATAMPEEEKEGEGREESQPEQGLWGEESHGGIVRGSGKAGWRPGAG